MLDKKQIRVIFFNLSSKWFVNQQRQLAMATMHLAQELLMNIQCHGPSRTFPKEMRALNIRSTVAGCCKVTTTSWKPYQSWSSYNYKRLSEELNVNHSTVVQYLKQIGKVKKPDKWVPCELTAKKKIVILKCCRLILHNSQPFLDRIVTCIEKWIL